MQQKNTDFHTHTCQHCGADRKWIETIIDDEFVWDERYGYIPNKFTDTFEHTGNVRCAGCKKEWTGT